MIDGLEPIIRILAMGAVRRGRIELDESGTGSMDRAFLGRIMFQGRAHLQMKATVVNCAEESPETPSNLSK